MIYRFVPLHLSTVSIIHSPLRTDVPPILFARCKFAQRGYLR